MEPLIFCLCAILALQARSEPVPTGPMINVNEGTLQGFTARYQEDTQLQVDKQIDVFLGVPFADPPVRFAAPEPKTPWTGVYDATAFKPACQQAPSPIYPDQSEDCLYLNVYAPSPKPSKAAVMVWIHGGGFSEGSIMSVGFSGGPIVSVGDVILVTISYRLSIFATFTTKDEAAPGNVGMLDQVAALKWVYENIEAFGGDKKMITLVGESAGAASVSFHLLSQLSRDYFTQAILQSGSSLAHWAYRDDDESEMAKVESLASAMNCEAKNSTALVECLRSKDAEELRLASSTVYTEHYVVVDGNFLEASPPELYKTDDFKKLPMMAGFTKDEASFYALFDFIPEPPISGKVFTELIAGTLQEIGIDGEDVVGVVLQEYVDWTIADDPEADYFQAIVDFFTDTHYACPADGELRFHADEGSPLFEYYFTHVPSQSIFTIGQEAVPWLGAGHAEDIPLVFGWPFIEEIVTYVGFNLTAEEKELSHKIIQFWTNFAKSGDPSKASENAAPGENEYSWPAFEVPGLRYKELSTELGEGRAIKARKCAFWREYFPEVLSTLGTPDAEDDDEENLDEPGSQEVLAEYRELLGEWRREFQAYMQRRGNRCPAE
nr:cholinesterase 1-like [Lytechinus pictus]